MWIISNCYIIFHIFISLVLEGDGQSSCEKRQTCQECLLDSQMCLWCAAENITDSIRCKPADRLKPNWCKQVDIQNPKSKQTTISNRAFSSNAGKIIQIKPQNIKLNLRVGDTERFNFSFLAAKDYPVDLYFLIDTSNSMRFSKQQVAEQGSKIYDTLMTLTNNVYMGIGTFIDKNAMPFVIQRDLLTYSFINHYKLTNNVKDFKKNVDEIKLGGNYDEPEGGLEALSQVISCKEEIGWRAESRKIIVFMTNSAQHVAGDGKLAGIVTPHDGLCHMKNGTYTKELELDYPSLNLINKLAVDDEVIIIFVNAGPGYRAFFKTLEETIKGSKYTENNASDDIATILKNIYEEISESLLLKTIFSNNERNRNVEITITPDCRTSKAEKNPKCSTKNRKVINFEGTLKVTNYEGVNKFKVDIIPEGIKESLTIDIEIVKDCECQNKGITNSHSCYEGGTYQCGICKCNPNRYGENCRCTSTDSGSADTTPCIVNVTKLECSGNGECSCGTCLCNEGYEGPYCQCDKRSCNINVVDGTLCSGHGKCDCGTCICDSGWTNDACDCPVSTDSCKERASLPVCSNRGHCECGACKCHSIPAWDIRNQVGAYCAMGNCSSAVCHKRQCGALVECALCHYNNENNTLACNKKCDELVPLFVEKISDINNPSEHWMGCPEINTNIIGCYTTFMYMYDEAGIKILIQTKSDCAESFYMIGGISLGLVLLIGLVTLVAWKLLTDARDRQEYERFKKQYASAMWPESDNPIYQPAVTTFRNPAFGEK